MNSMTSFVICEADGNKFDAGALRRLVFSSSIGTDNMRQGWVGLGAPLDESFSVGLDGGSIAGFSLRVDTRKPSSAALKLKLAEKIKEEEAAGKIEAILCPFIDLPPLLFLRQKRCKPQLLYRTI